MTVFPPPADFSQVTVITQQAHQAAIALAQTTLTARRAGLQRMAAALQDSQSLILEANTLDLEISREMAVPEVLQDWLKLTPERLHQAVKLLTIMGANVQPVFRVMPVGAVGDTTQTYGQFMPLGVIALVYEMFPELAAIAAGFCVQTGNALVLRGSAEASHTNAAIAQVLQNAIAESDLPAGSVMLASADQGISIQNLVSHEPYLSLVIPYGRASFVQQVLNWSAVPALRTAIGNCYLYCAATGDLDLARTMILDSHASEPDPVNAIEKVLLHHTLDPVALTRLFAGLQEQGFELRGDVDLTAQFADYLQPVRRATEWSEAYLKRVVSFRGVMAVADAIAWINQHSSNHADCLVTQSYPESRLFAQQVNSALLYINASPRFSRNPKHSQTVYLGVSNHKGLRRGLIGIDSFMAFNQVIQG